MAFLSWWSVSLWCAVVLAVVFGVAAVGKLRSRASYREYAASLADLGWLPPRGVPLAAGALVAAEVGTVPMLTLPFLPGPPIGHAVAAGVTLALTVGLVPPLLRGRVVRCRCFGTADRAVGWSHVARNGVLFVIAVTGGTAALAADTTATSIPTALAVSAAAAVAALVFVRWDDLVFLFSPPGKEST